MPRFVPSPMSRHFEPTRSLVLSLPKDEGETT